MDKFTYLMDVAEAAGALASGQSQEDVARRLNGNGRAVAVAAQQVEDYEENVNARHWTEEEEQFLEEALGYLSTEEIAEHLGRSENAVKIRWVRLGLDAPSKQPDELTANQAGEALGVDPHAVIRWIREGKLPGRRLPFSDRLMYSVKKVSLYRFAVNPMNWPYFENVVFEETRVNNGRDISKGTQRINDPHLRRLVERQKERWDDRWWSTKDIAEHHGVCIGAANNAIHRGDLKTAVKNNNWRVLRSEAVQLSFDVGHGYSTLDWSRAGDAFMVLAHAAGLGYSTMSAMMGDGYGNKNLRYRLRRLQETGEIWDVLAILNDGADSNSAVDYDEERGVFWTDWRVRQRRFYGLARAARRFLNGSKLTYIDRQYIRNVMMAWLRWFGDPDDPYVEEMLHYMTYGQAVLRERLEEWHEMVESVARDPFDIYFEEK